MTSEAAASSRIAVPTMSRCSCDSRLRAFGATTTPQTTTAMATATAASAGPATWRPQ